MSIKTEERQSRQETAGEAGSRKLEEENGKKTRKTAVVVVAFGAVGSRDAANRSDGGKS